VFHRNVSAVTGVVPFIAAASGAYPRRPFLTAPRETLMTIQSLRPLRRPMRLRRLAAATLLAGTMLGGFSLPPAYAQPEGPIQPPQLSHPLPDFVNLVKQVKPAVVSITVKMTEDGEEGGLPGQGEGQGASPFGGMPFPMPFPFGMQQQQRRVIEARGSGFIIDPDGTIVTNNHVVKNAKSVTVTLDDGTVLPAKIIGRDSRSDLAVIRVKANHKLPFIALGDSDEAQPGSWVVAVGNPFGLGGTVTAGIVSARGRDIGEGPYDNFIQIDAPINMGNSGGPLFTQDGKVVGVNTAIFSPSGGSVGIGFAIPSNTVKSVVSQLEKSGKVTRGFIGVKAQAVTNTMAAALHLPGGSSDERGALVASVEPDSPAQNAGLQPGDVITGVDSHHIGNQRELALTISEIPPGQQAKLTVVRNGETKTVPITVATLTNDQASGRVGNSPQGSPSLGVGLQALTPNMRQQLSVPDNVKGAVIAEVKQGSAAEQAGLQAGDVIVGVGDEAVGNPSEATKAIKQSLKDNNAVALRIIRDGQPAFIAVQPGSSQDQGSGNSDDDNQ
jgi:serine protease Do